MKTNAKRFLMIGLLALSLAVFVGCTVTAPTATEEPVATATQEPTPAATEAATVAADVTLRVFTAQELAMFDGKNGIPAYVAVSGIVYDVSSVPQWNGGSHAGGTLQAGRDQTEAITNLSPHGLRVLEDLPIVGTLE